MVMPVRKSGYFILGIGILLAIFSLTADILGLGEGGIQAAQLLGAEAGVVLALIGWGIVEARRNEEINSFALNPAGLRRILELPMIAWVLLGFLIIFTLLFIFPSFFNPDHRIHYFNRFIPEIAPIGRDLTYSTDSIARWLVSGQELYDAEFHVYPPFYAVVFAPLLLLRYPANYYFISAMTLLSMVVLVFAIPGRINGRSDRSISVFFFLTVIVSYGMLFELERGQFNVIAFMLCILAVYIFHFHNSFRHLAYLLFSVSVQLKIYPVLLIFMFIREWRDWKGNLMRLFGLGVFNFSLLFALGPSVFSDFIRVISTYTDATWSRPYNHSIRSFVFELATPASGLPPSAGLAWLKENLVLVEFLLMAYFFACLLAVVARTYKIGWRGINFDLLLISTLGALMLPSVSIDYKLPLLAPALALALMHRPMQSGWLRKLLAILLVVILSASYSVTLFSFIDRQAFPSNSLPMLLIMLTAATLLNFVDPPVPAEAHVPEEMTGELKPST
jgi:hypothetical protein